MPRRPIPQCRICQGISKGNRTTQPLPTLPCSPTADWISIRTFLALCAKLGIFPLQIDLVMAYVQCDMKGEDVFCQMPAHWAEFLPDDCKPWVGIPLLMVKALYGYRRSGKLLYEELAEWFTSHGFRKCRCAQALWYKYLGDAYCSNILTV